MSSFSRLAVATLVVMVILVFGALAATGPLQEGGQAAKPAARSPGVTYISIPGFSELRAEDIQQQLQLTDEQKQKLKAIGQKYYEETRQDWAGLRGMSPDERKKKYAELRTKSEKRMKEIRKQVEQVLSPDQLERLKQINLRTRGAAALANPRVLDRLGVTDDQKKKLREIRAQMQERMRKLRQDTLERTLEVLTPQQRKKLEELTSQGASFYGAGQTRSPSQD